MSPRWYVLSAWLLALASAVFWAYPLLGPAQPAVVAAAVPPPVPVGDLRRLLGADAPPPVAEAPPPAASRLRLLGVLASPDPQFAEEGVALIAIDDQPAKAYRVGMTVDGDTVLQAVEARGVRLGLADGTTTLTLELALPGSGSTGDPLPAGAAAPRSAANFPAPAAALPPPPPMANVAPPSDGTPQPFGGPPPAFGAPPPAAATPSVRRAGQRPGP